MKSEMENMRGRLQKAEREVVEAKEQCITLTDSMHQLEKEVKHSLSYAFSKLYVQHESPLNLYLMGFGVEHVIFG